MKAGLVMKDEAIPLLTSLARAVEDLYLKAQAALPKDQAKSFALYRTAYLAYHKQKVFTGEQDTLIAAGLTLSAYRNSSRTFNMSVKRRKWRSHELF